MELIAVTPYIRFADRLRFETPRHLSKTYDCRLLYVADGSGTLEIQGVSHRLTHGALAIFQPDTQYTFVPAPQMELIVLDFDYTQEFSDVEAYLLPCPISAYQPERAHRKVEFSDAAILNAPLFMENALFVESAIEKIAHEFQEKRMFFRGVTSTMFKAVLFDLVRHHHLGGSHNDLVARIMQYIDANISAHITNTQISAYFNYSPNYLNRLMLRHTGKTLHQYVMQKRIDLSINMIQNTELTIAEIAVRLGFNSPSHFSYCFRSETGFTPMQFREK